MSDETVKPDHILLQNVRLSFPDIWTAKSITDGDKPKFGAAFLLDKKEHEALIKSLKVLIYQLALLEFGGKPDAPDVEKVKAMFKNQQIKPCLHEGSSKTYDGYDESNMFLSTSSTTRPHVVDRDHSPLAEADGRPYAGCYVNAAVRMWVQNNNFGKRVNCELLGVQFVKDGEAFGKAPFKPEEFFPKLEAEKSAGKPSGSKEAANTSIDDEIPF